MIKNKSIVKKNFILTMTFGIVMGLIFPIYASLFFDFTNKIKVIIFTLGCIIAGLLVGLIAYLITKKTILIVVKDIGNQLNGFNSGDMNLTNLIEIESNDDIGTLVSEFNEFIKSINDLIFTSQLDSENSLKISSELNEKIDKTFSSVNLVDKTIQNVEKTSEEQVSSFIETKEGLKRLNDTVLLLITHVLELFAQMDELTSNLLQQSDTIDSLSITISNVVSLVGSESKVTTENLYQSSMNLVKSTNKTLDVNKESFIVFNDMISKIEDIANKTGILSINASIEAARSGNDGKGFKVIAQEIRQLSDSTKELSNGINKNLDESLNHISDSKKIITATQTKYINQINLLHDEILLLSQNSSNIKKNTHLVKDSYTEITTMLEFFKASLTDLKLENNASEQLLYKLEESTNLINTEISQIKGMSNDISILSNETKFKVSDITASVNDVSILLNRFIAKR